MINQAELIDWNGFMVYHWNVPMKLPGAYRFTNLVNGKCYNGISQNVAIRCDSHGKGNPKKFSRAIVKHGRKNFLCEPTYYLTTNLTSDQRRLLCELEVDHITTTDSIDHGYNVNAADGGVGPYGIAFSTSMKKWYEAMTVEQRREKARKAIASQSKEQLSERVRKAWANCSKEERAKRSYNSVINQTEKGRAERARKARENITSKQRSDNSKKGWAKITPEQGRERGLKAAASLTPEQRSEKIRKGWIGMTLEQRRARTRNAVIARLAKAKLVR